MAIYTLGVWTVRPGQEDEFVAAWTEMAERTRADFPSATATLVRDRDRPSLFISFGPWPSMDDIEAWRGSATFRDGVGRIRAVLEDFQPHTMDPVLVVGAPQVSG